MDRSEWLAVLVAALVTAGIALRLRTWWRRANPVAIDRSPPRAGRNGREDLRASTITPYVGRKIAAALPADAASDALERLASASFPMTPRDSFGEERIHLAVMKLVCDPWDSIYAEPSPAARFDSALDLALTDWRDLFIAAGLAHDDWPEVLRAAGYEGPTRDPDR